MILTMKLQDDRVNVNVKVVDSSRRRNLLAMDVAGLWWQPIRPSSWFRTTMERSLFIDNSLRAEQPNQPFGVPLEPVRCSMQAHPSGFFWCVNDIPNLKFNFFANGIEVLPHEPLQIRGLPSHLKVSDA